MNRSPLDILNTVFGFEAFRGQQAEIIQHVIDGRDGLVLMPTGGGKSLCYQVPALCRPGTAIVISPLIALMRDQVEALRQLGINAAALNSSLGFRESADIERALEAGSLDLVYVAPERLLTERFLDLLDRCRVALFAIDEAHCVSQWGHDFRPEYRRLDMLRERYAGVPRLALTATADGPTRTDIVSHLSLSQGRVFVAGFDRPNIRYRVQPKATPRNQLLAFLEDGHRGQSGIVYCMTRGKVDDLAKWLSERGFDALPYHAGLDKSVRARNQDRFLKDEAVVMTATIAFGMGIDKPDVRFVAHMDLPKSLEAYYQETGRAGRDGLQSDAWMAYGLEDLVKLNQLAEMSDAPAEQKRIERQKLDALLGYCETTRCRRQVLLSYFGEILKEPCGNCDTCLEPAETYDGTEAAQMALSCVYRTGQRFGAVHVIDVLMGADTDRIRRFRHDTLSTYGIGTAHGRNDWRSILRQLVALGLLSVDIEGHGGLRLSDASRLVLRGERRIELRREPMAARTKPARKREPVIFEDPTAESLFQALRARRMALARTQGVPPYVIFHDSTLAEMARARPRELGQLAGITGVGAAKLERYGTEFLDVIVEHQGT